MTSYESSWYWPLEERLPETEYSGSPKIRIALMDTGVSPHPAVIGGVNREESMDFFRFGPEPDRMGELGGGIICNSEPGPAFLNHGTALAGFMVGEPTGDLKLHGIAPRSAVEVVPYRVTDSVILGGEDIIRLAKAIDWVVKGGTRHRQPPENIKVINISLGLVHLAPDLDANMTRLADAIRNAYENGVIVCCAGSQYHPGMVFPAAYSNRDWCICCGPSTKNKHPAGMSWWVFYSDDYVTIAAPGVDMPSASWKDGICSPGVPELVASEGTSYSTAFTSAIAALWWARNFSILSQMEKSEVPSLFRSIVQRTSYNWYGSPHPIVTGGIWKFGPGILNPNAVLRYPLGNQQGPPPSHTDTQPQKKTATDHLLLFSES